MKCAIYMRVGRVEQLSREACFNQQETLMNYAAKNCLEVVEKYSDIGFSASNMNRPGLQALIADYNARKFESVLAVDRSRLSRKPAAFPFPVKTIK